MYADQNLLELDDVCLKFNLREIVTTRVRFTKLAICTIICSLDLYSCIAYDIVLAIAVVPCSLVQTPSDVSADCFDDVGVRISTIPR